MVGNPQEPLPKVRVREVQRALWVHRDGVKVCALDHEGVEGGARADWDAWERSGGGHDADGLVAGAGTPPGHETVCSGWSIVRWKSHLSPVRTDGSTGSRSSAVASAHVQRMHDVISERLVKVRPQLCGRRETRMARCWRKSFLPEMGTLEPGETSGTRLDVGAGGETGIVVSGSIPGGVGCVG